MQKESPVADNCDRAFYAKSLINSVLVFEITATGLQFFEPS